MMKEITKAMPETVLVSRILLWARVNLGLRQETAQQYLDDIIEVQGWLISDGKILSEPPTEGMKNDE